MEPRIRFTRTEDGTSIAFWAIGEGRPIVHMPWAPWSHLQLEWENEEVRAWYERLASQATLIRYDGRGSGLSDRTAADFSLDAQLCDVNAVVDQLKLPRFGLLGLYHSGPAAMLYAARHPERVAFLILWAVYGRGEDYYRSPRVKSIHELIDDWELYTETGAHAFVGWSAGDMAHKIAALMRESVFKDTAQRFFAEMEQVDVSSILPTIRVPTLVLHPRNFPLIDIELSRQVAAAIPDARFVAVDGDSLAPTRADVAAVTAALRDFLGTYGADRLTPGHIDEPHAGHLPWGLSVREIEVLRLVSRGRTNREIAEDLVLSPRTVERHIANAYDKIGVTNRAQATAFVLSRNMLTE